MEGTSRSPISQEQLPSEERQRARERNLAEIKRRSTTRIFEVEETRTYPKSIGFSYGYFSYEVSSEEREQVKPGTKLLFVQQSDDALSPIEGPMRCATSVSRE